MPIVFEFSWLGWMTTAHRPCFDHGESWKWVGLSLDDLNEGWGVNHENYVFLCGKPCHGFHCPIIWGFFSPTTCGVRIYTVQAWGF